MLEKQKKWYRNNVEKGKKWLKENELYIGIVAGGAAAIVGQLVGSKIFEDKKAGISIGHIENPDKSWSNDFGIETFGVDRFGNRNAGHIAVFDQATVDWVVEHLHKICDDINEHNNNL